MQTSTFPDLPSGQTPTEVNAGENLDNDEASNKPTPSALDDPQEAAGDLRDRDLERQASELPQISTRSAGAILLAALALGLLLVRAVSRR